MIRVDLPPPETPVTQVKVPSGIWAVTFWRLFSLRADDGEALLLVDAPALVGQGHFQPAGKILPGQAFGRGLDLGG